MITTKSFTKVWCPKLRSDFETFSWYPAVAQIKIDGEYELIRKDGKTIWCVNKHNKVRRDFPALDMIYHKIEGIPEITLIAELYWGEGKNNDLYKLLENKESDALSLYVHDVESRTLKAESRLNLLKNLNLVRDGMYMIVNNKEEAKAFMDEAIKNGYEGIVLKPCESLIGMANQWCKCKLEDTTEMTVQKIYENEERVDLKLEDKIIGCKAPDKLKKTLKVGQTVLVKHNGFTQDSVRHPTIVEVL